jgi:predicted PolB exonuclease-like 3'-5' exonuclease
MTALAADIETVPTSAALALPYPEAERQPPASYTKPETIAAWYERDRAEWETTRIKTYSLTPLHGRVVAIGLAWDPADDFGTDLDTTTLIAETSADEAAILTAFWERVRTADPLVTWNGAGFDVPFLLTRSAILGVTNTPRGLMKRYATDVHYDVKQVVCNFDTQRMRTPGNSLSDWAVAFGMDAKISHGSAVYAMYKEGRFADISTYAADDARLTLALYHRVSGVFA